MKQTNCPGCGQRTPYLIVRHCTACLRQMVRSMKGERD